MNALQMEKAFKLFANPAERMDQKDSDPDAWADIEANMRASCAVTGRDIPYWLGEPEPVIKGIALNRATGEMQGSASSAMPKFGSVAGSGYHSKAIAPVASAISGIGGLNHQSTRVDNADTRGVGLSPTYTHKLSSSSGLGDARSLHADLSKTHTLSPVGTQSRPDGSQVHSFTATNRDNGSQHNFSIHQQAKVPRVPGAAGIVKITNGLRGAMAGKPKVEPEVPLPHPQRKSAIPFAPPRAARGQSGTQTANTAPAANVGAQINTGAASSVPSKRTLASTNRTSQGKGAQNTSAAAAVPISKPSPVPSAQKPGMDIKGKFKRVMGANLGSMVSSKHKMPIEDSDVAPVHQVGAAFGGRHYNTESTSANKNLAGGKADRSYSHHYNHKNPQVLAHKMHAAYHAAGHHISGIEQKKVYLKNGTARHAYSFHVTHPNGGPTHHITTFRD